jgi:hypothetical protein
MLDARYPFKAKCYLGEFELEARLPRQEDDFATRAEAEEWLRENGGGTIEKLASDGKTYELVASVLPDSLGSAFVA